MCISIFNLKNKYLYVLLFISVVTFLLGPVMLGVHYETSIDLPTWFLVVNFVFTVFWGGLFGLIFLLVFLLISFMLIQFCCESCCEKYCYSQENSVEYNPNIPTNINSQIELEITQI